MQDVANSTGAFRAMIRADAKRKIEQAFKGPTQDAIAQKAARWIGCSPRSIVDYLHERRDVPAWVLRKVEVYLERLEAVARRIEGEG